MRLVMPRYTAAATQEVQILLDKLRVDAAQTTALCRLRI